jgi:serine/threonine-protein kinase RsbW
MFDGAGRFGRGDSAEQVIVKRRSAMRVLRRTAGTLRPEAAEKGAASNSRAANLNVTKKNKGGVPAGSAALSGHVAIHSRVEEIGPCVDALVDLGKRSGCVSGDNQNDVEVSLFESLANAVLHGNRQDPSKQVHVDYNFHPDKEISFVIKDEGPGFDPSQVADPTAGENIEAEHGRGILLMKTFMDEVRYENGGKEVHLRKKLPPAPAGPP